MQPVDISGLVEKQRAYFASGATREVSFRRAQLESMPSCGACSWAAGDVAPADAANGSHPGIVRSERGLSCHGLLGFLLYQNSRFET